MPDTGPFGAFTLFDALQASWVAAMGLILSFNLHLISFLSEKAFVSYSLNFLTKDLYTKMGLPGARGVKGLPLAKPEPKVNVFGTNRKWLRERNRVGSAAIDPKENGVERERRRVDGCNR